MSPPPRRRLARILVLLVAAAAVVAGLAAWRAATRRPALQLETATIDRGRIVAKVTATGTLSAVVTVQVGTQVSGTIAALGADFNSPVRKGQRIAKIDPALFEAALQQARANLVAAQGNLAKAQAQAVDARRQSQRTAALARERFVAQAEADTAQANADAADAAVLAARGSVAQAQASVHQASVNLAYTDIISPTDGIVISRNVDVGQTVAASLQAPTLFVIAQDLSRMQVDTSVAEADVGRIRDAMTATFTVDAYPAETFEGAVRQVRNAPQTVQNVVTYDAVLDVANPDLRLRPGMTATVTFVYAQKDDVLRVPNAALRFRAPAELLASAPAPGGAGRGRTLWLERAGRAVAVQVRTGISDGTFTEVLEGDLKPGDAAITDATGGTATQPAGAGQPRPPRIL